MSSRSDWQYIFLGALIVAIAAAIPQLVELLGR
jgi:hypothetical protein